MKKYIFPTPKIQSKIFNADPVVCIGLVVAELLQFLQQTREHDEIVSMDDGKNCCIVININRILMIQS
jgi:hypothetical protein